MFRNKNFLITLLFVLYAGTMYAATLKVSNKQGEALDVRIRYAGSYVTKKINPGEDVTFDSGLNTIEMVFWKRAGLQTRHWYRVRLDMPKLNVRGTFDIHEDGRFDSSRLGNNKRAGIS